MIKSLQGLRFIFAVMIFLHHFPYNGDGLFAAGGPVGVCFFIMLSGFVMSLGYGEKVFSEDFDFKNYYLKRFARLWPLHILCLIGFIVLNFQDSFSSIRSIGKLGINALLLQSWVPIKGVYFSGNALSWCLCDLMFCYLLFPLLFRLINRTNNRNILIITFLIFATYFIGIQMIPEDKIHAFIYISPICRLLDFLIGIIAYKILCWLQNKNISSIVLNCSMTSLTLLEIGVCAFLVGGIFIFPSLSEKYALVSMWWPICFIIIVTYSFIGTCNRGGCLSIILQNNVLQKCSTISFTFYMIHLLILNVAMKAINRLSFSIPFIIELIFCLFITLMVAQIINKYFEKPVADILSR